MSDLGLPEINDLVEVLLHGAGYASRVENVNGNLYTVDAPDDVPDVLHPAIGMQFDLVWLGANSRYAVPVRLNRIASGQPSRWVVEVVGEPRRHNRREYVRGGSGESIRIKRPGVTAPPLVGQVVDISEASVRYRCVDGNFEPNDRLIVSINLGGAVLETPVRVWCVRLDPGTALFDVVANYEAMEKVGQLIRRYILQQQMAERRRQLATLNT